MSQIILHNRSRLRMFNSKSYIPLSLRVGNIFLMFSLTILIGFLSFLFMVKFSEIHTKGYAVRKIELERDKLLTEREQQRKDIESLKSLQSIQGATAYLVVPRKTSYVKKDNLARNY